MKHQFNNSKHYYLRSSAMAKSKLRDLSNKRRKLGDGEQNTTTATPVDIDWISSLPDCLLCHILSFLPTTTAVATSVLSRRWRHLWQDLQAFDFNYFHFLRGQLPQDVETQNAHVRLVAFADAVLAHRRARDIRRLRLTCSDAESDVTATINRLVREAAGPHLEELQLTSSVFSWKLALRVPPDIFSCTALVTLVLGGTIRVELTQRSSIHLPSLKTLQLHLEVTDNVDTLLSGCPVLEYLSLAFFRRQSPPNAPVTSAPKIRVPSSSLKSLSIITFTDCEIEDLEIDTPSLEYLYLSVFAMSGQLSVRNLHSVVDASLNFRRRPDSVLELLGELRNARCLTVGPSTVNCLLRAPLDPPEFKCLLQLHLRLPCFDAGFVMKVLEKCHMLQVLQIDKSEDAPRRWTLPMNVPSCLESHLSRITFSKYYDSRDDREFIAYILQKGLVLKSIQICVSSSKMGSILEELSRRIPRGSKMCQLDIVHGHVQV